MSKKISEKEKLRIELSEIEVDFELEDHLEYVIFTMTIHDYDMVVYQRNRHGGGHSYDPLSKWKEAFHAIYDEELKKLFNEPLEGYVYSDIVRYFKLPKYIANSKAKTEDALNGILLPSVRPDIDNIEKVIYDLFNKIIYVDDGQIIESRTRKMYGETDKTVIQFKIYKEKYKVKKGKRK